MRILTSIFSLFVIGFVSLAEGLDDSILDSIYHQLSPTQALQQLVWVEMENYESLPPDELLENIGGLYLPRPLSEFDEMLLRGPNIPPLAIQLNDKLNPAPFYHKELPSILTLASITDPLLVEEYFEHLEELCKGYGIAYVVLPHYPQDSLPILNSFINHLASYNPSFFLKQEQLNFKQLKRKRDLPKMFAENRFWIINERDLEDMKKAIDRFSDKVDSELINPLVKLSLRNKYQEKSNEKPILKGKLDYELTKHSVIPVQSAPDVLPINTDSICLLADKPSEELVKMLGNYAYVMTERKDILRSKAPIIVQSMIEPETLLAPDRTIIVIGDMAAAARLLPYCDAGLLTTRSSSSYDYLIPQMLFGVSAATGRLPSYHPLYKNYTDDPLDDLNVLGYAQSEMIGIDSIKQAQIDAIIEEAIDLGATPGCQLAVAVDGSIILEKSYGHLTYDSLIQVSNSTIYDLASLTKVTATLLVVMDLIQKGRLDLDHTVAHYLKKYQGSNKEKITLRSLLSHNAGLKSYVPFWKRIIGVERMESFYYATEEDAQNDKRSYGMKPSPIILDSLKNWIRHSPIQDYDSIPKYVYSDIGFMILHQVVEQIIGESMEDYLVRNFYDKLDLERTAFNPLQKGFSRFEIAPTEYDYYFRDEQVWGEVHDRNAAVFGGVAGHAGLFANAHELMVMMQMILQEGFYRKESLLNGWIIDEFNRSYYPNNRRGLGWDKKSETVGNTSKHASEESFGHTGFTGTMIWVDPAYDLIFVFLSNKIYPNANNHRLNRLNVRTRVQDVVYEALLAKWTE